MAPKPLKAAASIGVLPLSDCFKKAHVKYNGPHQSCVESNAGSCGDEHMFMMARWHLRVGICAEVQKLFNTTDVSPIGSMVQRCPSVLVRRKDAVVIVGAELCMCARMSGNSMFRRCT